MDWATNPNPIWFHDPSAKPLSDSEKSEWFKRRQESAQKIKERQLQAAAQAEEEIKQARLDTHPYLISKGFPNEFGLVLEGTLLVPMRNLYSSKLQGYQAISPAESGWSKKMLYGMKAKDAVLALGEASGEVWLVEGYATALSVRAALRQAQIQAGVICCFSANNLINIARGLHTNRISKAFVFADNDKSKTGEQAAIESFCPWTMSEVEGWDANDIHQKQGLFSLMSKIMTLRMDYL